MNTLMKAERVLVDANRLLLEFAEEIGQGVWVGRESEAAMRISAISQELHKAVALMFASDGTDGPPPPSLTLQ